MIGQSRDPVGAGLGVSKSATS